MGKGGVVGGGPTPLTAKILVNHPLDKRGWAVPGGGRLRRGKILITTPVEWRGGKFFCRPPKAAEKFFRKQIFLSTPPPFRMPATPIKLTPCPPTTTPKNKFPKTGHPPRGKFFGRRRRPKIFSPPPPPGSPPPLRP